MDKKLWIVVQTSDADAGDVGVLGVFDNREAAYECLDANDLATSMVIALHHYPVQSKFEPETEGE